MTRFEFEFSESCTKVFKSGDPKILAAVLNDEDEGIRVFLQDNEFSTLLPRIPFIAKIGKVLSTFEKPELWEDVFRIISKWCGNKPIEPNQIISAVQNGTATVAQRNAYFSMKAILPQFNEFVRTLQKLVEFEHLSPNSEEGGNIFAPPILAAKNFLKLNQETIEWWQQEATKYTEASKKIGKSESLSRPLQKTEPLKQMIIELCDFLSPFFPPDPRALTDSFGKSTPPLISTKTCSLVAELIKTSLFGANISYFKWENGDFTTDDDVKPPTWETVKKTFHDRKTKPK